MRFYRVTLLGAVTAGLWACATVANAEETAAKPATVAVGATAPDFSYPKPDSTETATLSSSRGKKNVLLAFYPKAFTPGCTSQLCGYRDDVARFTDTGTEVIAISLDAQKDSDAFRKEHRLPFAVLGDAEGKVVNLYGIPTTEKMGTKIAQRSVVLIDKEGVVRYVEVGYDITADKDALYSEIAKLKTATAEKEHKH